MKTVEQMQEAVDKIRKLCDELGVALGVTGCSGEDLLLLDPQAHWSREHYTVTNLVTAVYKSYLKDDGCEARELEIKTSGIGTLPPMDVNGRCPGCLD